MKKLTTIAAGMLFLALVIGWQEQASAGLSTLPTDAFKCYPVIGKTFPNPKPAPSVSDQFESDINTVIKPTLICNPTSVADSGIDNFGLHLVCYQIKGEELLESLLDISIDNMFGIQETTARRKEALLCLPSFKTCVDDNDNPIACPNDD